MAWKDILETALQEGAWSFARSSGPGGQHVNRTETKAVWRWDLELTSLAEDRRQVAQLKLRPYLNRFLQLMVTSDRYRDRERNKADCIEKVKVLFQKAFYVRPPRRKTKPSRAQKQKRLNLKKHQSLKKAQRRGGYDAS